MWHQKPLSNRWMLNTFTKFHWTCRHKDGPNCCGHLKLDAPAAAKTEWSAMVDKVMNLKKQVKISLVGKYVELQRCLYLSGRSLETLWLCQRCEVKINWVNANDVTAKNVADLVWCGRDHRTRWFWSTWYRRENQAIRYARENDVPMLGSLLGNAVDMYRVCSSRFRVLKVPILQSLHQKQIPYHWYHAWSDWYWGYGWNPSFGTLSV